MKTLIALLILAVVSPTQAEDLFITFKGKPGDTCAWYRNTFAEAGYKGVREGPKPLIACKLKSDDTVTCLVESHGLKQLADVLEFHGEFEIIEGSLLVRARGTKLNMKAICDKEDGCYQFQMWNRETLVGYACDTANYIPPKAKPPALLNPNAAPYKAPVEKGLSF
jgi:hypothetical protein